MCGIAAYAGPRPVAPILLNALHALEYRGYDSAGIAILPGPGQPTTIVKRAGKLANLETALERSLPGAHGAGIAHTRWATHGRPSDENAHPHTACSADTVVVHNGIVENFAELRADLQARGHIFDSETDSETIAHLVEEGIGEGLDLAASLRTAAAKLEGSQAIVAMHRGFPGVIAAARLGNAGGVVIGHGDGEMFLASDLAALLPETRRVTFLADGEFAALSQDGVALTDRAGVEVAVSIRDIPIDPASALKGTYEHFMLKEIMEQPEALADTIQSLLTIEPPELRLEDLGAAEGRLSEIRRVVLIGMGTSLHAAMLGRTEIEQLARLPAEADNASEFRYRRPVLDRETLVVSVSQSGETVDVLEAMNIAREAGALQITVCNTAGAQTTRVADGTIYTHAGLERGVASTKCFTTATAAIYILALKLAEVRGLLSPEELHDRLQELGRLPDLAARVLAREKQIANAAGKLTDARDILFLGRSHGFPVAMEGALKMKEISYIHAEGYAAGEMKHGPIALIDEDFKTVAIATEHALRSKLMSNIQQVQARGGTVISLITDGDDEIAGVSTATIAIPSAPPLLEAILASLPLQQLAYRVALDRGCDIDQPRNLAKTVTVE